jgi:multimeric flavodoxin WrbA
VKVAGLVGSPRHGGNTYALVNYTPQRIEAGGFATEIIELSGRNIQACRGYDICRERGICANGAAQPVYR